MAQLENKKKAEYLYSAFLIHHLTIIHKHSLTGEKRSHPKP